MRDDSDLRRTLIGALEGSGRILLRGFGRTSFRLKGRANLITEVDRASEEQIVRRILRDFPDHDYITEERPPRRGGSEFLWIVDPLDGTTNYAHGYPAACVTIGLFHRGRPLLAGTLDPFRGELFFARKSRGCFINGRRARVSRTAKLEDSLLITGFPYDRAERSHFYVEYYRKFMTLSHDVRRSGSAALDMAWIAAGRADGYWEFNLSPWDVAAGLLLVEEAGGKVSDFSGSAWNSVEGLGKQTLATNGRVHSAMLKILR